MYDSVTICKNTGMPITGKVNIPTLVSLRVVIANDTVSLYTFGSASGILMFCARKPNYIPD